MKKSQKGFAAIEGLLLVIIIGLIIFVGWYVWHISETGSNNQSQKVSNSDTAKTPEYKRTTSVPKDWVTYKNTQHDVSLSHPKTWFIDTSESTGIYSKSLFNINISDQKPSKYCDCTKLSIDIYGQSLNSTLTEAKKIDEQAAKRFSRDYKTVYTDITINGKEAVKATTSDEPLALAGEYFIAVDNKTYVVNLFRDSTSKAGEPTTFSKDISKETLTVFESIKL